MSSDTSSRGLGRWHVVDALLWVSDRSPWDVPVNQNRQSDSQAHAPGVQSETARDETQMPIGALLVANLKSDAQLWAAAGVGVDDICWQMVLL